jgi:hypothetical protein
MRNFAISDFAAPAEELSAPNMTPANRHAVGAATRPKKPVSNRGRLPLKQWKLRSWDIIEVVKLRCQASEPAGRARTLKERAPKRRSEIRTDPFIARRPLRAAPFLPRD